MTKQLKIGDRVGYTQAWLQSVTAGDHTSHLWKRKGVVIQTDLTPWIVVQWDNGTTNLVHPKNIATVGSDRHCRIDAKGWAGWDSAEKYPGKKAEGLFATGETNQLDKLKGKTR